MDVCGGCSSANHAVQKRGVGLRRSSQEKEEGQQESDMSQKPKEESVPRKECTTVTNAVERSSLIRLEKNTHWI